MDRGDDERETGSKRDQVEITDGDGGKNAQGTEQNRGGRGWGAGHGMAKDRKAGIFIARVPAPCDDGVRLPASDFHLAREIVGKREEKEGCNGWDSSTKPPRFQRGKDKINPRPI